MLLIHYLKIHHSFYYKNIYFFTVLLIHYMYYIIHFTAKLQCCAANTLLYSSFTSKTAAPDWVANTFAIPATWY